MIRREMAINQRRSAISVMPALARSVHSCTVATPITHGRSADGRQHGVRERQMLHRMRLPHTGTRGGRAPDVQAGSARVDRDQQLVEALRRCDPESVERLAASYGERAYRLAVRITGNGHDAEEAVQDALWSVVRKIDTFRGDSAFGSWLYRIVSNAAYEKARRRPQAFVEISLEEVLPPFQQDGRHAGVLTDWSSRIDDPAMQTELRAVLSS